MGCPVGPFFGFQIEPFEIGFMVNCVHRPVFGELIHENKSIGGLHSGQEGLASNCKNFDGRFFLKAKF